MARDDDDDDDDQLLIIRKIFISPTIKIDMLIIYIMICSCLYDRWCVFEEYEIGIELNNNNGIN